MIILAVKREGMMKYLMLLLACTAGFAQDSVTKVTIYRLAEECDDCPCSIKQYVESEEYNDGLNVFSMESTDKEVIANLIEIKKEALKWKKAKHFCTDNAIGGDMIHNMIVISGSDVQDTLYTTTGNYSIVEPEKQIQYIDEKQAMNKSLKGAVKAFFESNLEERARMVYRNLYDSIPATAVLYGNSPAYNYSQREFTSKHDPKTTGASFDGKNRLESVVAGAGDTNLSVDGITTGIRVEELRKKFPSSTKHKSIFSNRFEDIINEDAYYYLVTLQEDSGSVIFYIKEGLIDKIEVNFVYAAW